jgi:hypothetical protein
MNEKAKKWIELGSLKRNTVKERTELLKSMLPQEAFELIDSRGSSTTIKACMITLYKILSGNYSGIIYEIDKDGKKTPVYGKLTPEEEAAAWSFRPQMIKAGLYDADYNMIRPTSGYQVGIPNPNKH